MIRQRSLRNAPWHCLALAVLLAALPPVAQAEARRPQGADPMRPPNLVLIVLDTLRADHLRSYGFDADTSPELDAFAKRGVLFRNTIAQASWTRPSIASLLTSRYPRSLGIYAEKDHILASRFLTLAELLKEHGYSNFAATANPNTNTTYNFEQGYDEYSDSTVRFAWMDSQTASRTRKQVPLQSARQIFDHLLERAEQAAAPPHHLMATVMDIHEANDSRVDLEAQADLFPDRANRRYLQAIRMVSGEVKRFVDGLAALPGWERTLFVILSDHGEGLDSHPGIVRSVTHGSLVYESHVRVPLIFYSNAPDLLPRGLVVDRPVRLLDLMPTLLDVLALSAPEGMEGVSLAPLLEGREVALPDEFVVETRFRRADVTGVYAPDWKYIEHRRITFGTEARELQPMGVTELGRRTNQIATHPEIADRLRSVLSLWESKHPEAEPTVGTEPLDEETRRQLESLGYLESPDDGGSQ